MTIRVGVAVSAETVRAVAVSRRGPFWRHEVFREPTRDLAATIDALLAAAPIPRWRHPVVSAVIGPSASQVKALSGLPPLDDPVLLAALLRENASAFFLRNGSPLVTTGVRRSTAGAVLGGAVDLPYVEAVRDACRAHGWVLGSVAPLAAVLPLAFPDQACAWHDSRLVLDVVSANGTLESVRCRSLGAAAEGHGQGTPAAELAALGAEGLKYAAAYCAARLDAAEPLVVDLAAHRLLSMRELWRPLTAPAVLLLAALVVLLASPLRTIWAGRQAEARVAAVRPGRWHVIASALGQLDHVTRVLIDIRQFSSSRASVSELLGALAKRLPPGSAIVSLDLTEEGGQIVTLTNRPADVLAAVQATPGVATANRLNADQSSTPSSELRQVTIRFTRTAPGGP